MTDALGAFGSTAEAAIPLLIKHLEFTEKTERKTTWRRHTAAKALFSIGVVNDATVEAMVESLDNDPHPIVQTFAAELLGKATGYESKAIPSLRRALALEDDIAHRSARKSIAALGRNYPEAVDQLVEAFNNKRPYGSSVEREERARVRVGVVEALGEIGTASEKAIPLIVEAVNDESVAVQRGAAQSLGEIRSAQPDVIQALSDVVTNASSRDATAVTNAIIALGRLGDPASPAVEGIIHVLENPASTISVRTNAASTLGKIGKNDVRVVPALLKSLESSDTYQASVEALAVIGIANTATISNILITLDNASGTETVPMRAGSAEALGKIGPRIEIVHTLIRHLKDPAQEVRAATAQALGDAAGGKGSLDIVVNALIEAIKTEQESAVRLLIVSALHNNLTDKNQNKILAALIDVLGDAKEDETVKKRVIKAFGETKAVGAIDALTDVLGNHPDETFREAASQALRLIGQPALPAVRAMKERLATLESLTKESAVKKRIHRVYNLVDQTEFLVSQGLQTVTETSPLNNFAKVDVARQGVPEELLTANGDLANACC